MLILAALNEQFWIYFSILYLFGTDEMDSSPIKQFENHIHMIDDDENCIEKCDAMILLFALNVS